MSFTSLSATTAPLRVVSETRGQVRVVGWEEREGLEDSRQDGRPGPAEGSRDGGLRAPSASSVKGEAREIERGEEREVSHMRDGWLRAGREREGCVCVCGGLTSRRWWRRVVRRRRRRLARPKRPCWFSWRFSWSSSSLSSLSSTVGQAVFFCGVVGTRALGVRSVGLGFARQVGSWLCKGPHSFACSLSLRVCVSRARRWVCFVRK